MRLSCNLITNSGPGTPNVWYDAGQPIDDHLVPDHALQYRISEKEGRQLEKELAEWRAMLSSAGRRKSARRLRGARPGRDERYPLTCLLVAREGELGLRVVTADADALTLSGRHAYLILPSEQCISLWAQRSCSA